MAALTERAETARPGPRRLAPEERRAQILRVAVQVFRSRPYEEVSLDDVARAAGITRGLINHHFGTKRDLYVEVVRQLWRLPELPVPEYVQGATVRSRLQESIGSWLGAIERNRDLWLASMSLAGIGDPEIKAIVEESREDAARRMAEVMGLGPVAELDDERMGLLRAWEALAEGAILQWLEHGRLTREQVHLLILETAARASEGMLEELAAAIGGPARRTRSR